MNNTSSYDLSGKRVWVAGHRGLVGKALVDRLQREDCAEVLCVDRQIVDLTRQSEVEAWVRENKPDAVFVAAAKVGGILANNSFPVDFLYNNVMIATNIISSWRRTTGRETRFPRLVLHLPA